jgi:hypothetical protein
LQTCVVKTLGLQDFNLVQKIEILQTCNFQLLGLEGVQPVLQVVALPDLCYQNTWSGSCKTSFARSRLQKQSF